MFFRKSFLPNVIKISTILISNFNRNKVIEFSGINKRKIVNVPIRLPNNSFFREVIFFKILLVPKRRRKSKKKFIKKTKSK